MNEYDLIVVGGGPAGYVGAIRAAQLGKKVACVEQERAGGTCLNWGCIPTKALLANAKLLREIREAEAFGITVGEVKVDFAKVMGRSRVVSDKMAKGVEYLFKTKKVDYMIGTGKVSKDKKVTVTSADGKTQELVGKNILLATGAKAKMLPGLKVDGKRVLTSREALALTEQPKSIIIIGAGAIGVEFAYFFNALGTKVTLVEMLPRVLPVEDAEVSDALQKELAKQGIEILIGTKTEKLEVLDKGVKATLVPAAPNEKAEAKTVEAECVLVAVGVAANLDGALADGLTLALEKNFVKTNDRYETSTPGIFAAGDLIGPPWLAHVASHEAIEAVEGMFVDGKKPHKVTLFPGCTYCQPQVASIGLTEAQAKDKGAAYKIAKFPYRASGKAVAAGHSEGFVKLVVGQPHGEILGAHIIGDEATELIAELGLAMHVEATLDELATMIHAHPTLGEMIHEAALVGLERPIHL